MNGKELLKELYETGWKLKRIRGSHHYVEKNGKSESIPVHGSKDLPTGLLNAILKRTGLK